MCSAVCVHVVFVLRRPIIHAHTHTHTHKNAHKNTPMHTFLSYTLQGEEVLSRRQCREVPGVETKTLKNV